MQKVIGLDLVEISRFKRFSDRKDHTALIKIFLPSEISYCFGFKDPSPHLAGLFAAKEAVSKALGIAKFPFSEIEISHSSSGKPVAFHKGKALVISISISHTRSVAAAIALD